MRMVWSSQRPSVLRTSFPQARQEGRLHHAAVERLRDAVVIPQRLVVDVHQGALQLPDLSTADSTAA